MEIGNSKILKGLSKIFNKNKVEEPSKELPNQLQIGSKPELPDIRSSNIVLPNKKYYIPQSTTQPKSEPKPIEEKPFIAPQISETVKQIRTPQQYEQATVIRPQTEIAQKIYHGANVAQFKNTETGDMVIRIVNSESSYVGTKVDIKSDEVMEIMTHKPNEAMKYVKDYEHNAESEMVIDNPLEPMKASVAYKKTTYRDESGNITKTEETKKSPYLQGVYDITETDAAGKTTVVSKTTKMDDGSVLLEKNLVSLDGTTTKYTYQTDESGSHKKMTNIITDKDGNELSRTERTFDKISDTVTYSSVNEIKYKSEKTKTGVNITNETTGETTKINSYDFDATEKIKAEMKQARPSTEFTNDNVLYQLVDTIPADEMLKIAKNIQGIVGVKDALDSSYNFSAKTLFCSGDNIFIVNHELGHSKDTPDTMIKDKYTGKLTTISGNNDFKSTFEEEKASFVEAFPAFEEKFVDYFLNDSQANILINQLNTSDKVPEQHLREIVAETNAINGLSPEEPDVMGMRTAMLQRYFPRTIATVTNLMQSQ